MNRRPDRIGFVSYTSDPSFRQHHFGKLEPMEEPRRGTPVVFVVVAWVFIGIIIWRMVG